MVFVLSAPLFVGWLAATEETSTVMVVGLRNEGEQATITDEVHRSLDFDGPTLVVVNPICVPLPQCVPARYEELGRWTADGDVTITRHGNDLYQVQVTRENFGYGPALTTAVGLPLGLALLYAAAERLRIRRRDREQAIQRSVGSGADIEHDPPHSGVQHRAQAIRPQAPPRPEPPQRPAQPRLRTEPEIETHIAPPPPAPPPARSRAPIPVRIDATGLPAAPEFFARVGAEGIARTHIDADGGYADFDDVTLWVEIAHAGSTVGLPGDRVRIIAPASNQP
ncbi:hypothetical protein [Nocardia bovistercoris]|uniref:Uncharacterized protein n=1 Tax=Nocardia bovistercoris TaxID=2785916 RepID=A0A931I8P6_9NOCA|nr:hypothetical protein [Nocardia bovistercoris]MBH0775963.1 hypothetical protein [Nocardia bovistercoris]